LNVTFYISIILCL